MPYSTRREMYHSQAFVTSCLSRNISIYVCLREIPNDQNSWRVLAGVLAICQEQYTHIYIQILVVMLSVCGHFTECSGKTGWSHTENQHVFLLASHLTFGPKSKWPSPILADQRVNLTNLVGHRRLLLLPPSSSSPLSDHLFGACGRGNRNGELLLILLCFNHSLQRLSCSFLDGRREENEALLYLA